MKYPVMTIAADGAAPSKRNRHRKTHGFSCTLLRAVLWPAYKPAGNKTVMRPVFLDFCGTESEHRAFVANLRCGRAAQVGDREAYEFLKSEPYAYAPPQRCEAPAAKVDAWACGRLMRRAVPRANPARRASLMAAHS